MAESSLQKRVEVCIGMANVYAEHKQWLAAARYLEAAEKLIVEEPTREQLETRRKQYIFNAGVRNE